MSIHVMNAAWRSTVAGSSSRFVLLALADRADDAGYCWPGVETLARKTDLSTRTVQRVLRELEEAGLLTRIPRFTEEGDQTSNLIRIDVPLLESLRAPDLDAEEPHPMDPGRGVTR